MKPATPWINWNTGGAKRLGPFTSYARCRIRLSASTASFNPKRLPTRCWIGTRCHELGVLTLVTHSLAKGQTALFIRRWLGKQDGERPSPVQAACWLDIKRHYMEPGLHDFCRPQ